MIISVVIPAYNEEVSILPCLQSVYKQSRAPDEVIVVDNNSSDHTVEVVRKNFPRTKIVFEPRQGIASARDAGFRAATGDIVARTDADSLATPQWLLEIESFFSRDPACVAVSGPIYFKEFPWSLFAYGGSALYLALCRFFYKKQVLIGPNMAVRKDSWEKTVSCSSNEFHEDVDLSIHLSGVGAVGFCWKINTISSARRIFKTPLQFFVRYPQMLHHTFGSHRHA